MTNIPRFDGDRGLAAAVPDPAGPSGPAPSPWSAAGDEGDDLLPPAADPAGDRSVRPWIGGILAVLVIPLLLATSLTWGSGVGGAAARAASARVVSATDLEQTYGIRVNLVAVTAAGGLVDMRFTVLDAAKAAGLFHDASTTPRLFVQASGALLRSPKAMAHKMTVLDGASYFFLFPNAGGAVQAGTGVSVVVGDIRLEPIVAQS